MQLRDYQESLVNNIRGSYLKGYRAPLAVLPTGGGKTVCFSYIAKSAYEKKKTVWIMAHRVELVRQTVKALKKFGLNPGVVNPKFSPDYGRRIQVGTVQTMIKRLSYMPTPDLIIIDEAHHATGGNTWGKIIQGFVGSKILGVTATPARGDGKGLGITSGGHFDMLIQGPTVKELISLGFLAEPIVYCPQRLPDLSDVGTSMGDFNKKQLTAKMNKPMITGHAVTEYREKCSHAPAVVFCTNVQHAQDVAQSFRDAGYRSEAVYGDMESTDRDRILNGLSDGSVHVVTSCDVISEGTDIPEIECAISLRPTKSLSLHLQQMGRALRVSEGKDFAIILDHAGNCLKHGLPTMDRDWSLQGIPKRKRKATEAEPVVKQCPKCYAMFQPVKICPQCGHEMKIEGRKLKHVDGKLVQATELTPEQEAKLIARKKKNMEVGRASTLEELQRIAEERGYKPNWPQHVWAAKQAKRKKV